MDLPFPGQYFTYVTLTVCTLTFTYFGIYMYIHFLYVHLHAINLQVDQPRQATTYTKDTSIYCFAHSIQHVCRTANTAAHSRISHHAVVSHLVVVQVTPCLVHCLKWREKTLSILLFLGLFITLCSPSLKLFTCFSPPAR